MFDAKFIRQRKTNLKKAKLRIEKELEEFTKKKGKNLQTIFPDIGTKEDESAQEVEMYESYLTIEKSLEKRLEEINKALDRIKNNSYGKCGKCGKDISEARLKAYSEAAVCLKCPKR